jgi:hypothetical protein
VSLPNFQQNMNSMKSLQLKKKYFSLIEFD